MMKIDCTKIHKNFKKRMSESLRIEAAQEKGGKEGEKKGQALFHKDIRYTKSGQGKNKIA